MWAGVNNNPRLSDDRFSDRLLSRFIVNSMFSDWIWSRRQSPGVFFGALVIELAC